MRAVLQAAASGGGAGGGGGATFTSPRAKRRRTGSPSAGAADADDAAAAAASGILPVAAAGAGAAVGLVDGPVGADGTPSAARTLYIGGVAPRVSAALLYELALQCGPLRHVRVPPGGGGFAFVEFEHEASVHWAARALSGLVLCGSSLRAAPRAAAAPPCGEEEAELGGGGGDGGAQLHLRPLPPGLDEWDLWDLGALALDCVAAVRLPRDAGGAHRGFGFISYTRGAEARRQMRASLSHVPSIGKDGSS